MKMKKKTVLILALCWVAGIAGGYYIGVESASIPSEQIDFNYFNDSPHQSEVQSIENSDDSEADKDDSYLNRLFEESRLFNLPKRIFEKVFSPSACVDTCKEKQAKPNCASVA